MHGLCAASVGPPGVPWENTPHTRPSLHLAKTTGVPHRITNRANDLIGKSLSPSHHCVPTLDHLLKVLLKPGSPQGSPRQRDLLFSLVQRLLLKGFLALVSPFLQKKEGRGVVS